MPIFTELNREIPGRVLEDFPSSLNQSLEARFQRSFSLAPTSSALRLAELETAKGGRERERIFGFIGAALFPITSQFGVGALSNFFFGKRIARATEPDREPADFITPGEANEIGKPLGLNFKRIITRDAFDIIVNRKRLELARQSLIDRAPGGLVPGTLGFGADLFAQAVDPLNVASAFIPVAGPAVAGLQRAIGPARFAIMAAKVGKGRSRLFRGSLEGFVGNVAIEPIVALNASREQADYTMLDSLLNIGFGTILGGGLHTVGGRIGDSIRKRKARAKKLDDAATPAERERAEPP